MTGFDYIRIRGFETSAGTGTETDPGLFEIYQGIGSSGMGMLSETPISNNPDLAEGIWQGQNAKLESENHYCDQLQDQFKKKQQKVSGIRDKFLDIIQEVLGEFLGNAIGVAAGDAVLGATANPILAGAAAWLAGIMTELSIEWGIDALAALLTRGNELLDGIKDENDQLLQIEKSRENYEYREQVLIRHREDIKMVLEQIRMAEKDIEVKNLFDIKALLERLTDLALRDDTIELGNMRLHSKGRVVNF